MNTSVTLKKWSSILTVVALAMVGLVVPVMLAPASSAAPAGLSPIADPSAANVTADALPTVQIDGIVWSQATVGSTVYAGGKFAKARPAGAAVGVSTTIRNNLLSYDIRTGILNTSFAPNLNGMVKVVAASPDGSRIYVGGDFTAADGQARFRLAAYSAATGALIANFNPAMPSRVNAIVATNSTVYVGGSFTNANGVARNRLAAFNVSNGALLAWHPGADAEVQALTLTPDGSKLIVGGSFQNVNGSPAYGLAAVNPVNGSLIPWIATSVVRNAGANAAILSLTTDGTSIIGTGYVFGSGGNLEGTFSADPTSGSINWIEDCHGDTYGAFSTGAVVYTVSHAHYCGNIGGFPQSNPWATNMRHALAFTPTATGTIGHDPLGYFDWAGNPSPSLVNWFPEFGIGNVSGASQAAWSVTGNSQYISLGGEFPTVNQAGQQGLVRFAVKPIAPVKQGPRVQGTNWTLSALAVSSSKVRVSWLANWDRDQQSLTYSLVRDGNTAAPVFTTSANSTFWNRPTIGYVDTNVIAGKTYQYRIYVKDPDGNQTNNGVSVAVTIPAAGTQSSYSAAVNADGATTYWPLNELSGSTALDNIGFNDADESAGVKHGAAGAIGTDKASTFDGTPAGSMSTRTAVQAPDTFTTEAWINTSSTQGGKIIGFGNAPTGTSGNYDRHVYMDNSGHLIFGVHPGGVRTIVSSKTYNDGQWHQVVSTLGSKGMTLYVDGLGVGSISTVTAGQPFTGYWRVGGDNLGGWTNQPSSNFFNGSIDDVSIYPSALTKGQVVAHYVASGRTSPLPAAPADAYGSAVFADQPDIYWRLGEASGLAAADSGPMMNAGTYSGGFQQGAPGALSSVSNSSVTFNGSDGMVASNNLFNDPTTYSEEAWFRTTTSVGGKIMGFGNNQSGQSSSYDRHIYMQNDGQIVFGTYTGRTNTITTDRAFNDGLWHHVVATQGVDGMKLYLDGQAAGSNPETGAQDYQGYWKVGGDTTWSSSSPYFAGTIDEAAVYPTALSAQRVVAHFHAGGGNVPPTAAFAAVPGVLKADFDASSSTDVDGTVSSYGWDFGDGMSGTGLKPSHIYVAAGSYNVTLTVADNNGATSRVMKPILIASPAPNVLPTASFTSTITNLQVAVDGSGSIDSDGSISSYVWSWGDGASGNGVTAQHNYAEPGIYDVSLTVTDNSGGSTTSLVSRITVTAPAPNVPPNAVFTSTTSDLAALFDAGSSTDSDGTITSYSWDFGDGTSGSGETASRTYAHAASYNVTLTVKDNDGLVGLVTHQVVVTDPPPPPNLPPVAAFTSSTLNRVASFNGTESSDPDGTISSYAWDFGDGTFGTGSSVTHTFGSTGVFNVTLTVTDNLGLTGVISSPVEATDPQPDNQVPVAAFTATTTSLKVHVDAGGSSDPDGSIVSYSWDFGDGGHASTKVADHTFADAGSHQVTLVVTDNLGATDSLTKPVVTEAPVNQLPVAAFTSATTNLSVNVNGIASSDADGSIVSYAWDFGDGASATGVTAQHAFNAGGSYSVKLTVTDDRGGTGVSTNPVTVAPAPPVVYASDQFARTLATGLGSADQGGSWTLSGPGSWFSADGSTSKFKMLTAGAGPAAFLNSVSAADIDAQVDLSLDKAPTGGSTTLSLAGRRSGTSDYRLKVVASPTSTALYLSKTVNGVETTLKTQVVAGLVLTSGDNLRLRFRISGTGATALSGKLWKVGTQEPAAWSIATTHNEQALQGAGGVGLQAYLSGIAANPPVTATFDNFKVSAVTGP